MSKLWKVIAVVGFIGIWIAGSAYAWDGPGMGKEKGDRSQLQEKKQKMMDEIIDGLGLTDEQKQKIQAHHEQMSQDRDEFSGKSAQKREELKRELEKPEIDKAKIDQLVAEISASQAARLKNRVDGVLAVRAILTPEQFAQMNQKIEAKREAFMKMKKDRWGQEGKEAAPARPSGEESV